MNKTTAIILVGVLLIGAGIGVYFGVFFVPRASQLRILNWGSFIDESLLADFQTYWRERSGDGRFTVYIDFYTSNEELHNMITAGGHNADLIVPSDYMVERMIREELIQPLNMNLLPALTHVVGSDRVFNPAVIDPSITNAMFENGINTATNTFAVPYMYGTMGIMYDTSVAGLRTYLETNGWASLWSTAFGPVAFKNIGRESYTVAQFVRNRDVLLNNAPESQEFQDAMARIFQTPERGQYEINDVRALLQTLPNNTFWDTSGDDRMNDAFLGQINQSMGVEWSVNAVWAMKYNPHLQFFIPEEGTNLWINNFVIPTNAVTVDAAHAFINFVSNPARAKQNMEVIGGTSPILEAQKNLIEAHYEGEAYYSDAVETRLVNFMAAQFPSWQIVGGVAQPRTDIIARTGIMRSFGATLDAALNAMMIGL